MAVILVIEDEASIRRVLKKIIEDEDPSHKIIEAEDGAKGIKAVNDRSVDLVLCDIKMPVKDGMEVLQEIIRENDTLPVIMISGHGDIQTAVECMKMGAYDYIEKPPDLNRLLNTIRNALSKNKLELENKQLKKKVARQYEMIGDSKVMQEVRNMIDKVAPTDARALIMGENGTGKELVAHWIHQKSHRSSKPMIEVNCAAIPSELIESELFGHIKGAFTSANKNRAGKFEAADQTTLFLDEVGDMSLSAQAKVLRALQEGKIQRVGSEKTINVNVRVIAATNKELTKEIEKGNFREDLYHRLAVIVIKVPNLNERVEDIPELADFFAKKIAEEYGSEPKRINDKAKETLKQLNWTGNIRELRNVVERLIILGGKTITDKDVKQFSSK